MSLAALAVLAVAWPSAADDSARDDAGDALGLHVRLDDGDGRAPETSTSDLEGGSRPTAQEQDPVLLAIDRGLAYLATQQALLPDGSFPAGQREHYSPVGVTALCALAYLAGGNSMTRGPYRRQVGRAVEYLLSRQVPAGEEHEGYITDTADKQSRTHGHGLATLALAQAYAMSPNSPEGRRIGTALELAVKRIEVSQGTEGGWEYEPFRMVEHEGSVTVCLVQALRAARNAGLHVDPEVIAGAVAYVKKLQDEKGGFRYGLHEPRTSIALTGGCLSTLQASGIYDGTEIKNGYDYVWRELAIRQADLEEGSFASQARFPFYERFYLAQALWQHPREEVFRDWARGETKRVLVDQHKDGSWTDRRFSGAKWTKGQYGSSYATAMNCLYLAIPEGLLPIFQR